ncbi:MAG TPA: hypothetical protein VJM50_24690 [Pyrinomonadaceae bacterium]|nr:hypothetical protein [Pyrinomonadaceae bacterium]
MYRVRVVFTGSVGSPHYAIHHFVGSGSSAEAQTAVDNCSTLWSAVDAFQTSGQLWATDPVVFDVDPVTGNTIGTFTTAPASGIGAIGGDALPPASQMLIHWRTGVYIGGREVRGKTFVPGLTEAANESGGRPVATTVTGIKNAADAMNALTSVPLGIWSRTNGVIHPVAQVQVPTTWYTQRRRGRS